ncbi:hypothetical protein [Cellulomonas shaoxiangyii]|uniref:Uncharacterized protein n=1 Tax=Cellulomonas shaoxiangyii TaxID=2566013 RepID=A0A4V1CN26_9CELL|nr:hypothetical protein [Cellulomonas shaoxiangyii]QCB94975.1 hypothetical protein E5225_16795 [Cellulomonas shaoxiangyii]TGY79104.1 hypothetical protein E5226_15680 [Cellulomonas shaoxiangyii]
MNAIEAAATRLVRGTEGDVVRPLEMPRSTVPTLATPALAWAGFQGVLAGYAVMDMVFGYSEAEAATASVGFGEMGVGELIAARQDYLAG